MSFRNAIRAMVVSLVLVIVGLVVGEAATPTDLRACCVQGQECWSGPEGDWCEYDPLDPFANCQWIIETCYTSDKCQDPC